MTVDDAYAELGLPPGASHAQAKAAWRGLVSRWHPDRNGHAGASARMQRINRALEQIRNTPRGQAGSPSASNAAPDPVPPHTVRRRVELTLEEAAAGCVKILRGNVVEPCGACLGKGQAREPLDCDVCAGRGKVHEHTWFGWYGAAKPCADCGGSGAVWPACQACEGKGRVEVASYRVSVRLPPGVRDGDLLHVTPARTRSPVALDIEIALLPHPLLVRDGDGTLRCELQVDGFGWIANHQVEVPTLQGPQMLSLQRGQVMYRLPGRGFPSRTQGVQTDLIVMVVPRFPEHLSREQERLLDKLAASTVAGREPRRGD